MATLESGMPQQRQVVLEGCYKAGDTQMEDGSTGGWGKGWEVAGWGASTTKQLIVFSQSQFRALSDSVGKIPRSFI